MIYPGIDDYMTAMQAHRLTVLDPLLAAGTLETDAMGLPRVRSGTFALTYKITAKRQDYAFRCFNRERKGMQRRYTAIHQTLDSAALPYFVDFAYIDPGIRVNGQTYPAIRMQWAEGQLLFNYIEANLKKASRLRALQEHLDQMALTLEQQGLAHGDIQLGNVLVESSGSIKLVDYDGMYVPDLATLKSLEIGHPNFQHPERTALRPFDASLDRFSFALIHASLSALIEKSILWDQLEADPESLLLRAADFTNPGTSDAFNTLKALPASGQRFEQLEAMCASKYVDIPTFSDFLSGKLKRTKTRVGVTSPRTTRAAASTSGQASSNKERLAAVNGAKVGSLSERTPPRRSTTATGATTSNRSRLANMTGGAVTPPPVNVVLNTHNRTAGSSAKWIIAVVVAVGLIVLGVILGSDPQGTATSVNTPVESQPAQGSTDVASSPPSPPAPAPEAPKTYETCYTERPGTDFDFEPTTPNCLPELYWQYDSCYSSDSDSDMRAVVLQQRIDGTWKTVKRQIASKDNCTSGYPWTVSFRRMASGVGTKTYRLYWPSGSFVSITVTVRET